MLTKYPRAVLVIGGDRNDISISTLLDSISKLRQIVTRNTCNGKIFDVLLINIPEQYPPPTIVPPIPADDPSRGCPSDHSTVVSTPLSNTGICKNIHEYTTKVSRPLPNSGIIEFGQWITRENWDCLDNDDSPDQQVEALQNLMTEKMDYIFPTKTVRITQKDLPFLNAELKKLDRLVKKEYNKKGKTDKYENMKACYDEKMKKAALDHLDKNVRTLKESDPGKAYATLKKMGAQPGDMLDDGSFTLISHLEVVLHVRILM